MNNATLRKVNAARTVTAGLVLGHTIPFNSEVNKFKSRELGKAVRQKISEVVKVKAVDRSEVLQVESESLLSEMEKLGETNLEIQAVEVSEGENA